MAIQYDENGIIIQNLSEILDETENACRPFLGNDFVISGDSVCANLLTANSNREVDLQELLLFIANQLDPDQAEGVWLDYICALNNIQRYNATKSIIPITITGAIGTTKNKGEITIVDESTDEYYINNEAFAIDETGTVNTTFEATSYGEIKALSTSTFSLKTPSLGINSVAYNTSGTPVLGRNTETDAELRVRRADSTTYTASSILSSIKASVSRLDGVRYINAYENDTINTVDTLPPKSFEVVVVGGDDNEIASAILSKKPAGIQAYGTTIKTVQDEDFNQYQVGFTRPTEQAIDLKLVFVATGQQTEEWINNLKSELVTAFSKIYNVGDSVYVYRLYSVLNSHPEITNATSFEVRKHGASTWASSVAIGKRELAQLSEANITISQSA